MLLKELLKKRNDRQKLVEIFKWFQRYREVSIDEELINEIRWHNAEILANKFLKRERFLKEGETKTYPTLWTNIVFETEAAYRILGENWETVFFDVYIFPREDGEVDIHLNAVFDYPPFGAPEEVEIYPPKNEREDLKKGLRLIRVIDYLWGVNKLKEGGRFILGFYRDREFENRWVMYLKLVEENQKTEIPDKVEDFLNELLKVD